jgi:hypothetical protein
MDGDARSLNPLRISHLAFHIDRQGIPFARTAATTTVECEDMMSEIVHEFSEPFSDESRRFRVQAIGSMRSDGTWSGLLRFIDLATGQTFDTSQETSQPTREALQYWALGIEPVYLEGAFKRAQPSTSA